MGPNKILLGTGGWHYLPHGLADYTKKFGFVEVNSTFYNIFHPSAIESWRRSVPDRFEFSIKCYSGLTHNIGPRPTEDAFRVFDLMVRYCDLLEAKVLVLESPAFTKLDEKFVDQARSFFGSVSLRDNALRIAWEFRRNTSEMPDSVISFMKDFHMIHVVDLTFEDPRFETDILYSRVFGAPAKKNILDLNDLNNIKEKVHASNSDTAYIVGHSLKMVDDTEKIRDILFDPSNRLD